MFSAFKVVIANRQMKHICEIALLQLTYEESLRKVPFKLLILKNFSFQTKVDLKAHLRKLFLSSDFYRRQSFNSQWKFFINSNKKSFCVPNHFIYLFLLLYHWFLSIKQLHHNSKIKHVMSKSQVNTRFL